MLHVDVHAHVARGAENRPAGGDTVPGRLLIDVRLTAVRWLFQGASQSSYNERYCVTELLRYCVTVLLPLYCVTAVGIAVRRVTAFTALG
jgi:hypothetical protein